MFVKIHLKHFLVKILHFLKSLTILTGQSDLAFKVYYTFIINKYVLSMPTKNVEEYLIQSAINWNNNT